MQKIVVIVGPTGVGKTEVGLRLATKFNGEIINADSRQVYRELRIGTSLPSEEFFKAIPHHLYGVSPLTDSWDAARFQEEADRIIIDIGARKHLPIVVGGTGLYVKSLLFGLFSGPPAQPQIRERLEAEMKKRGLWALHEKLNKVDPQAAQAIHPNDPTRIIRALEVFEVTGKPISKHQNLHKFKENRYDYLKLGLNKGRKALSEILDQRVDEMVESGLEAEVLGLKEKYGEQPLLLRAIGYKEWFPYFKGETSKEEVIVQIKAATRQFAKRQMTWFRKEKDIFWFDTEDLGGMEEAVGDFLQQGDRRER